MAEEQQVGAVQLGARLHGVSPPVTRRLRIAEQASLAKLHASLQVAFGSSDEHLYTFRIRGWQFGDPARAIELALAGGGVDIPLAAFGFEIGESFLYSNRSRIGDNSRGCILVSASGLAMPCSHHSKCVWAQHYQAAALLVMHACRKHTMISCALLSVSDFMLRKGC